MSKTAEALVKAALEIGAIKLKPKDPFTWASGYRMPIYNDNRLLLSNAESRLLVAQGFSEQIAAHNLSPDVIAGTATAGIPHATTLADYLKLPLSYVRSKAKEHGLQNRLEGAPISGKKVVLVEDLVSTGGSSLSALKAIREEGGEITHCLSIFSYGFPKAADLFSEAAAQYLSLLDFSLLLKIAQEVNYLDSSEAELLSAWQVDPFAWGEQNGFPKVS